MQYGAGASVLDMWMPLNFGQFLRNSQLNPEEAVEYIQSLAMEWIRKRERACLKASWAARVRWGRVRGQDPSSLEHPEHLPSIDFGSISGQKKLRTWMDNCKKRSEKASRAARARWARRASTPSIAVGAASPLLDISPVLTTASSATTPTPSVVQSLAERIVDLARGAFAGAGKALPQRTRRSRGSSTGQGALPVASDARYDQFRDEVLRFWRKLNSGHECPWEDRDRRALEKLLHQNSHLTFEVFHKLIVNRENSENINPSQMPRRWLRNIWEFTAGPLNQYGRLKAVGVAKQAGVYTGPSIPQDEVERLAQKLRERDGH